MDDFQAKQEDELMVLQSIYSSNFVDLREVKHGKKKPNPIFKITLFPMNSESQHELNHFYVQIDLKIKFGPNYPNEPPGIILENDKGLSVEQVRSLHKQLTNKAQDLKGSEMVYQLSQIVSEFLYANNKPPTKSFYEQRMENKFQVEMQKLQESYYEIENSKIDEQLFEKIHQAVDEKKKMLQLERKKERELEKRERLSSNNSPSRSRSCKSEHENDMGDLDIKANFQPFVVEFKEPIQLRIKCFKLVRTDPEHSFCIYRGIETETSEIFSIYEWKICLEKNKIFEQKKLDLCHSEMYKIESEFRRLSKLTNNYLVKYIAYKFSKETNRNVFTVQICLEYIEGNTIEMFINNKQSYLVSESTLKKIINQLLDMLELLHSNSLVHRDLKASCVHMKDNTLDLKLSDYEIVKKLNNLYELVSNDATNISTSSAKWDIHQLGLLVLSLFLGEKIESFHTQVPSNLPPELKNFINCCFKQSEKVNCKFLREHPFMKKISEPGVRNLNSSVIKRTSSVHYHDDEDEIKSFTDYSSQSRLNKEFDVIGLLGQGAYGEVLKVKNKLDQRSYAIKRIRINPNSKHYNKLITREIKLLSRLNHENVVRYYSTWVEQDTEDFKENDKEFPSIDENFGDFSDLKDYSDFSDEGEEDSGSKKETLSPIESETEFEFEPNSLTSQSSEESIGKALYNKKVTFSLDNKEESDESVIFAENSSENLKKKKTSKKPNSKENFDKKMPVFRQYIFIQMEYCGGKTLKDLIDNGLYRNEDKVWVLFREILQGLNHIHEQGMIHRDLKPSNVLIDLCGHAKIGDFGLATSRFKIQKEHITVPGMCDIAVEDNAMSLSLTHVTNTADSLQHESECLSGAVGTALYVAPELMIPYKKNKYMYTQKVDIYSLGIVFYEMCFPFSTIMERISVLQKLRQKDAEIKSHVVDEKKEIQLSLIKLMLDHDPSIRPSAKQLLLNESIPRKADEIALEELLEYSFKNKQSTNYKRIFKAIFDQKCSLIDDASFYATNAKSFGSLRQLQIRECVHSQFVRIFQNHGGYMLNYPLLTPYTQFFDDYNKAYRLTDDCGLVLCLAYNHRIPLAKCLARNGQTNIKRYHIGKVFSEKMKLSGQHPREYYEASFDIISSISSDCMAEIEILSIMNDVINSFVELSSQNYVLVINHTFLLNAILQHCRISENDQKNIYYLLSEYNNKLIKSASASRENRAEWLNGRLPHLNLNSSTIEKLLNFLLKNGEPEKILSEMKILAKSDYNWSKLAKESFRQLKLILENIKIMDIKIPIVFSASFVLPVVLHPSEYSGFIFQLQIRRKNKNEYDILASGGRYDSLISKFANRPTNNQRAIGISFDFEKIMSIISEKSSQKFFRSEVAVCSIGDISINQSNSIQSNSTSSITNLTKLKKNTIKPESSATTNSIEIKNRLRLYKQLLFLNSNFGISTHMLHEKFNNTEEVDKYCKLNCINSYSYINENSILINPKTFSNNESQANGFSTTESSIMEQTGNTNSKIFLSIRSWIDRGFRFNEKEFNLTDFLALSNQIIQNMSSMVPFNSGSSNLQLIPSPIANTLVGSGGLNSTRRFSTSASQSYTDFVNSMLSPNNTSLNPLVSSSPANTTNSASLTNLNSMSQLNVTLLLEPANRQQTNNNVNKRKLEQHVIGKLGHVFAIFSSKTRIELIVIETHENVIQILSNHLHLEQDKANFRNNWNLCMDKINNKKYARQLTNFRLEEILYELRYVNKSKVFIIYGYKSDQFKLLVAA